MVPSRAESSVLTELRRMVLRTPVLMPKSVIMSCPSALTSTLPGLMSWWMMPWRWM